MISPTEALARLLALAPPVAIEQRHLNDAVGRWAAAPVHALRTQPAADLSAMDGYAIRHADLPGPWHMAGMSAAGGHPPGLIRANECVRIFTGAPLPENADTVVIQEDVRHDGAVIALSDHAPPLANHVRKAGCDFLSGQCVIEAGQRINAARIGLAALAGLASLSVRRRIRVAILASGNELVAIGQACNAQQIPSSNSVMLRALLADLPVDVTDLGIVADELSRLEEAFSRAAGHDIIVSTGGASVGDYDLVRPALIAAGAEIDFWKIAMRPGKPLMAGRLGDAVVLGLPGNPVSAFTTATLFLRPLISHLAGAAEPSPRLTKAQLGADLPAVGIRTDYVRAHWHEGALFPLQGDSAMLAPLSHADVLIVRPARADAAKAGDPVDVIAIA